MKALLIVIIVIAALIYQAEATQRLRRVQPKRQGSQPKAEKQKTLEELQREYTLQEWVKAQKEAGKQVPYVYCSGTRPYCCEYYIHVRPRFRNLTDHNIKGVFYTVKITDTFDNVLVEGEVTEAVDVAPWGTAKSDGKILTDAARFDKVKVPIEQKMVKVTVTVKKVQWANGKTTENLPAQAKEPKQPTKATK